ncbi:MAG TPA: baseplate J/gp47 family protein, partial [Terriglobales bacterium]|nr:baseplate J/gp47 family protein [Terriglobales bacterium]
GKHVAIWSPDPAVLRLAEESGFRPEPGGPVGMPVASPSPQRGPRPGARPAGGRPFPGRAPGPPAQPADPYGAPGAVRAGAAPAGSGRAGGVSRIAGPGIAAQTAANARIRIGAVGRRLPANITQYQPTRFVLYGAAALTLIAGLMAVLFYVPTARVTLVAQAQPFSTAADITADTTAKSEVHVRLVTIANRNASQPVPSTGQKVNPGQPAAGQFTYVDNCPAPALAIPNGQRLLTSSGIVFAQIGEVIIDPGAQKTVPIKAVQTGQAGNVAAGQIVAIDRNAYGCLTGSNEAPTAGGTDDQKQTVIQTSDIQGARATLEQQLRQQIINELNAGAQKGETMVGQPLFTKDDFNTTHNVDDNVGSFTATLVLSAEGDYYSKDDINRAFTDRLAAKVPAGQQLTTNNVVATYAVTASPGGHLDFNGSANGYIAPQIDVAKIKAQLAGKPATQAHDVLTRLPVQRSVISQSPPLPLMPLSASRIYIDYGVEAQTPAKSS